MPRLRWSIRWLVLAILVGALVGVGSATFGYASGLAYLSNDPAACRNCHIMNEQFDSWRKGPHHSFATCNDCHVPPHFPDKYLAKARNGYHHSMGFTFQPARPDALGARDFFEEPIQIKEKNSQVSEHWVRSPLLEVNRSCQTCHPYTDEEVKARVEGIQDLHYALLSRAGQAATRMLDAIVAVRKPFEAAHRDEATARARAAVAKRPELAKLAPADQEKALAAEVSAAQLALWREAVEKDPALHELAELQRAAQWRLDFVAAENSMGFHAPQELARILGESIDLSRQAEVRAVSLAGGKLPEALAPQPIPAGGTGR